MAEVVDPKEQRRQFKRLVREALETIPEPFRSQIQNLDITVARRPTAMELKSAGVRPGRTLFGLYHGIPLTRRGAHYGSVLPDKITLYMDPLMAACDNDEQLKQQVRRTVVHEIAHHFGIDDDRLKEIGAY
jgi:predicted Zn-dependent protease with MMP-like domain